MEETTMRKWIFSLTLAIVAAVFAATPVSAREVTGGFKFGLGIANVHGDDAEGTSGKGAFSAGAFLMWNPNRVFTFQPEFHFIQKGVSMDMMGMEIVTSLNYLEFPFLIKLSIPLKRVRPCFIFGDYLAFRVSHSVQVDGEDVSTEGEDPETVDAGLIFGTGIDIEAGRGLVMVEYRFELGALNISPDRSGSDVRNMAHLFTIGYGF
jgi:hypothetical protein